MITFFRRYTSSIRSVLYAMLGVVTLIVSFVRREESGTVYERLQLALMTTIGVVALAGGVARLWRDVASRREERHR